MRRAGWIGTLLLLVCVGCGGGAPEVEAEAIDAVYPVRGQVVSVEDGGAKLKVAHEQIPGFMAAMTMPFAVDDPSESAGLKPGDKIAFELVMATRRSYIRAIERLPAETDLVLAD